MKPLTLLLCLFLLACERRVADPEDQARNAVVKWMKENRPMMVKEMGNIYAIKIDEDCFSVDVQAGANNDHFMVFVNSKAPKGPIVTPWLKVAPSAQ